MNGKTALFTNHLSKPLTANLGLLLYFILLYGMVDTIGWIERGEVKYALYTLVCVIPIAYVSTWLYGLLHGVLQKIYLALISLFGYGWVIIDIVCNKVYHKPFNYDFAALIKFTDPAECSDFISTYFSANILIWILVYTAILGIVLWYSGKITFNSPRWVRIAAYVSLLLCTLVLFYAPETGLSRSPFGKTYLFSYIKCTPDLHDYLSDPDIIVDMDCQPENIVVILGESHSRNHNWLNGYKLETNPETKDLIDNGLYVYSGVTAPGTSTLITICQYMSTYRPDKGGEWYEGIALPEVLKKGGFHTSWISNQGKRGLYDNAVTRYAELCDTAIFTAAFATSVNTALYDEAVLPYIDSLSSTDHNFTVIHLLGSHLNYQNRYPKAFEIFTEGDYADCPENQRQVLADYDNSIVYSDHVVRQIIERYKDKEAIVIYFSDHGQDIFDTDPKYFGHARDNEESIKYGKSIPFYIYLSDKYRERFPEMSNAIMAEKDSMIHGESIFYRLLDYAGIKLIEDPSKE